MKTYLAVILAIAFYFPFFPAQAQLGGSAHGPTFGGELTKLFGENSAFSAALELQTKGGPIDEKMTLPGKIFFDQGKTRFEMDISQMQGAAVPAGTAAQMKAMGMEKMVSISRPDKKLGYIIYPGLQAYVEMPMQDSKADTAPSDFKLQTTELGKETVDGHSCVKNKAVVTDKEGKAHESTVWNARDLKDFPIRIDSTEAGVQVTMLFKDVKLEKPEPAHFDPPKDFTKYDSMMAMMQESMAKRMPKGQGAAPEPTKP